MTQEKLEYNIKEVINRAMQLNLDMKDKQRLLEIYNNLPDNNSLIEVPKNRFVKIIRKIIQKFEKNNTDHIYYKNALEVKRIISSALSKELISDNFCDTSNEYISFNNRHEQYAREYIYNSMRFEFSDNSLKILDLKITSETYEKLKERMVKSAVDKFIHDRMDILNIKEDLKLTAKEKNNELLKKVMEVENLEPYYGTINFMQQRIKAIREALIKMSECDEFANREDIKKYINFCREFNVKGVEKLPEDKQRVIYNKYENFFLDVLKIEEKLSFDVEKIWKKRFSNMDKFKEYKAGEIIDLDDILEDGKMGFLAHGLNIGGLFKAEEMNKVCCAFITEKTVTVPGEIGLIYPMDMKNVLTISPEDAGSWVIDKEEFLKRGCPNTWQFADSIDDRGNRMFFEESAQKHTKLLLPDDVEQQTIETEIRTNGEMLNCKRYPAYNETVLTNKDKKMLPVGVFIKTAGEIPDQLLKKAEKVSEFYDLPILNIDLSKLREMQGLDPEIHEQKIERTKTENEI